METVSILIPSYNAASWLGQTIESALNQSWKELEVIVLDDGSTDASLRVARTFLDRGVTVLSQSNRGASAARNALLRVAQGQFIQFLDADDLLAPDKIALQMARLGAAERGYIASCAWGRFLTDPMKAAFLREPTWCDMTGFEFQLLHAESGWMMQPGAWLCPREILELAGPWDESLTLNDDGEYFCRVMLAARGILFCEQAKIYYRSGLAGSLSRRNDRSALESLWRSTELNSRRILSTARGAEKRSKAAVANLWQRLAYECFPTAPDLADSAEGYCRDLGGSPFPPPGTATFHRLSRLVGWRHARRLLRALGRA